MHYIHRFHIDESVKSVKCVFCCINLLLWKTKFIKMCSQTDVINHDTLLSPPAFMG